MLIAMLNSTFLLIGIFKFDCTNLNGLSFDEFWLSTCETDWKVAFSSFSIGIPLFLVMLGLVSWVVYWSHPARNASSAIVTIVAFLTLIFWSINTYDKWNSFLIQGTAKLNRMNTGSPPITPNNLDSLHINTFVEQK